MDFTKLYFASEDHKIHYEESINKCRRWDSYHQAFFYLIAACPITWSGLDDLFDFENDCIKPEGLYEPWQTGGTTKLCRMAFNLWNDFAGEDNDAAAHYTPSNLFCCEFAPYFVEAIKLRYPEYFKAGESIPQHEG